MINKKLIYLVQESVMTYILRNVRKKKEESLGR